MFIDTHCHINMMVKKEFDVPLTSEQLDNAYTIIKQAHDKNVSRIINVGTSLIESKNCVTMAHNSSHTFAAVGIHPNDCTPTWHQDLKEIKRLWFPEDPQAFNIVAIGECGLDRHYPDYNLPRQIDAFKAQIELALEYNLGLIVHTREAGQETLKVLEEYHKHPLRAVIHCFSEDEYFAQQIVSWGWYMGIGGTITYPKNEALRTIVQKTPLEHIVLETDAPFLPVQARRGQQNHPEYIVAIAEHIALLKDQPLETIMHQTTTNAQNLFLF